MDDYEVYEKECEEIRETNEGLLELFDQEMTEKGLSNCLELRIIHIMRNPGLPYQAYL